ncbi:hypothetical protein MKX01_004437 [Papaver californicum]|nr:hypothetical protein MKX01_004437 [Papaver californicum]
MESGGQATMGGKAAEVSAEFGGQPPTVLRPIATSASTVGLLKYGGLILRVPAFVFSLISFSVMASNKGFFDKFDGFSYVLAACVISAVYTLLQNVRKIYYLSTGNSLFEACTSNLVDFVGDQIVAYLLLSAASAAAPSISLIRKAENSLGRNMKVSSMSSASTGMAFLAFFPLALSAMLSGYKLSTKTYV